MIELTEVEKVIHKTERSAVGRFAEPGNGQEIGPERYIPLTLRTRLLSEPRLPAPECLALATALASALECLHSHDLVHRDIKPANIIFVNGRPKRADIGLVPDAGGHSHLGTHGYLPPEGSGGPRADVFALGKVIYEMAFGLPPHAFPARPVAPLSLLEYGQTLRLVQRGGASEGGKALQTRITSARERKETGRFSVDARADSRRVERRIR